MPFIEVLDLTEDDVATVSDYMSTLGLKEDADFTLVHGKEWEVTGVRLMTAPAMQVLGYLA
jgi:hypothetical protein